MAETTTTFIEDIFKLASENSWIVVFISVSGVLTIVRATISAIAEKKYKEHEYYKAIEKTVERIKSGRSKDAVDNMKPTKTKTRRKESGTFGYDPKIGGKK